MKRIVPDRFSRSAVVPSSFTSTVELLRKLLGGELSTRWRKNVAQARSFADMLEQAMRRYQNRTLEAAQVIEELIGLARKMREAQARGEALGLTDDELAFYDVLEANDSAVKVPGNDTLRTIARELVKTVRANVARCPPVVPRTTGQVWRIPAQRPPGSAAEVLMY